MPIYRDNKKVVAIYRGGEKVTKAYRGEQVVFSSVVKLGAAIKGKSATTGTTYNKVRINGQDIAYTPNSEGYWEIDASLLPENITSLTNMFGPSDDYLTEHTLRTDLLEVEFTDLFDASNVTVVTYMFHAVGGLKLKNLPTMPKCTRYNNMFDHASLSDEVTKETIKNLKINANGNISKMFAEMDANSSLDLTGWDFTNVFIASTQNPVFYKYKGDLVLDNIILNNDVTTYFLGNATPKSLSIANPDLSNVTSLSYFFNQAGIPEDGIDVSTWDVSKVNNFSRFMYKATKWGNLSTRAEIKGLKQWDVSSATDMTSMFNSATRLIIDISGWQIPAICGATYMFSNLSSCKLAINGTTFSDLTFSLFSNASFDNLSISNTTFNKMDSVFNNTIFEEQTDLSGINVSDCKIFSSAFKNNITNNSRHGKFTGLDKWDMSSATDLSSMFRQTLYRPSQTMTFDFAQIENWNTSKVTQFNNLFYWNTQTTSFDLSNWNCNAIGDYGENTEQQYLFSNMFNYCSAAQLIDISGFKIPDSVNVIDKLPYWDNMFTNCSSLTTIHFSDSWDCKHLLISSGSQPFQSCSALTTITGTWKNLNKSLDMHWSPLTHDSALIILNALIDVTDAQTLTFSTTTYATLTEDEIATATAKNWTIAQA